MKVMVCYNDNSYDIVEDYCLDYLIRTGNITGFCRSDKWVKIGIDPVRDENSSFESYVGKERRKSLHEKISAE
ncbi:GSU3473 family protein [Geotalea sp. SG265]|uniref:GSU3473 family protein n=1 Tax=Geotalea sp. SG265 TaxID=2922867 RepID=UPI001FAE8E22|nr:hypothetical protein [Geotalea sp. SG265]